MGPFKDIGVEKTSHVALVEIRRPPDDYFDIALIRELATAFEALDESRLPRSGVGCGARPSAPAPISATMTATAACCWADRRQALRIFISKATGCSVPRSRSSLPFTAPPLAAGWAWRWWPIFGDVRASAVFRQLHQARLSFGIGLTVTLPAVRPDGGGADVLYQPPYRRRRSFRHGSCRSVGAAGTGARRSAVARHRNRRELAAWPPTATRRDLRGNLADRVRAATDMNFARANAATQTNDFKEGVKAMVNGAFEFHQPLDERQQSRLRRYRDERRRTTPR